MAKFICIGFIIFFIISPLFRCFLFNLHRCGFYGAKDIFLYIKNRQWRIWNGYGLDIYVGLFGKGKTLSASKYVISQAKHYNLNVLSNIKLNGIPYTPLVNYNQIIDAPENTIIFIDEISTVFNARSWKDFNMNLLFQILQCRKNKKKIVATAQRFAHVDKLIRDITAYVIDCDKHWRFVHNSVYDAYSFENALNPRMIKREYHSWSFIRDKDYKSYDTSEIIDNAKKTEFISNADMRAKYIDTQFNPLAVSKLSRRGKKRLK